MADPLAWLDDPPEPAEKPKPAPPDPLAWLDEAAPPDPVDVGPTARAARGGGSPSRPREMTDEQLGLTSGPVTTRSPIAHGMKRGPVVTDQEPGRGENTGNDYVRVTGRHPGRGFGIGDLSGPASSLSVSRGNPNEMADPLVQMGTASAMAAPLGAVGGVLGRAAEGAVSNAALGGSPAAGAGMALLPNPGAAVRTLKSAGKTAGAALREGAGRVGEAAAGRVSAKATQAATGQEIGALAPNERVRLADTFGRHPELRDGLVKAKANPEKAHTAVSTIVAKADSRLDEMTPQITAKGDVDRMLADYDALAAANRGDTAKTDAINRQREAVAKTFGGTKEATAEELRRLTRSVGRGPMASTLYGPIARQLEKMAKQSDVDVPAFMAAHRDVATLTPYAHTLNEKAVALRAQRGRKLMETLKAVAPTAGVGVAGHFGMGIDPKIAAAVGVTAYGATKLGQAVARRVDFQLAKLADVGRKGPIPRVMLEDAARSGVPPALLLQMAQRSGVHEEDRRGP